MQMSRDQPAATPTATERSRPTTLGEGAPKSALIDVLVICAAGLLIQLLLGQAGVGDPSRNTNAFVRLYWAFERPFMVILMGFTAALAFYAQRGTAAINGLLSGETREPDVRVIFILSALVLAVTWAGTDIVLHRTPLSMDEFSAAYQAKLFANGEATSKAPIRFWPFAPAMTSSFIAYDSTTHTWSSAYLPVYALIRALFVRVGAEWLTNATIGALTIPVIWVVARKLWPRNPARVWFAVAAVATSSQFILNSMSSYAMPAHLLLNLVWLSAFLRRTPAATAAAGVIGVLALGLHNPVPHALFAAPFLFRLLRERRWSRLLVFAVLYSAAGIAWLVWLRAHLTSIQRDSVPHFFALPDVYSVVVQVMSLVTTMTWLSPIVPVCLFVGLRSWRTLSHDESDIAAGLVLTFGFYFLFSSTQGHGWGYRYLHPVLGNIALIAATGADRLATAWGQRTAVRWAVASVLLTACVQWPVRARQVSDFVLPFSRGFTLVRSPSAQVVIMDTDGLWYGQDLVRNDPFLKPPIVLRADSLTPELRRRLFERYGAGVRMLGARDLARVGWPTVRSANGEEKTGVR
jgi:hypothetical protein